MLRPTMMILALTTFSFFLSIFPSNYLNPKISPARTGQKVERQHHWPVYIRSSHQTDVSYSGGGKNHASLCCCDLASSYK
jgi:hypothetical protein